MKKQNNDNTNDACTAKKDDGIEKYRLTQDFISLTGVKKIHITIPLRKPQNQEFVRVRAGDEWRLETAVLELKQEREHYLVERSLWSEIPGEITPKVIFTTINRQGVCFLWPIKLPGEDGRLDPWNQSAIEAAQLAMKKWVRVSSNRYLGAYDVYEATGKLQEPLWPDLNLQDLINISFKDRVIDTLNHPVVQRLMGMS